MRLDYPAIRSIVNWEYAGSAMKVAAIFEYADIMIRAIEAAERMVRNAPDDKRNLLKHMWAKRLATSKVRNLGRPQVLH